MDSSELKGGESQVKSKNPIAQVREKRASLSQAAKIKKSARRSFFRKTSVAFYCLAIFLLPIFFFPSPGFSFASAKVILIAFLMFGSGIAFFFSRTGEKINIPSTFFSVLGAVSVLLILSTIF